MAFETPGLGRLGDGELSQQWCLGRGLVAPPLDGAVKGKRFN